jgi:molybdate transport system substrate-binding protein
MRRGWLAAAVVVAAAVLAGCGNGPGSAAASGGGGPSPAGGLSGPVTVFAAASLTESFTTLGKQFEAAHPGVRVTFNFGASPALAESISQGAPADVFASASTKNMDSVVASGDASDPAAFAENAMEIAVPPANPGGVNSLSDLAKPGLKVALCQPQVPCGVTAQKVFHKAKISVRPVTLGADVKAVLTAVRLGEVDAGVVYKTDVQGAGDKVNGIQIPAEQNASTAYPIAALTHAPNGATARAFADYVLSPAGTKVLTEAGFASP